MALDVTNLCMKSHTDKHRGEFPHSKVYDWLFASFKDQPICFLEIGVNKGGSIPVWEQYFPNAKLLAVDINPACLARATSRTHIELVDQSDAAQLKTYADRLGPFDIIVDDGSHMTSHQITTFETLWSYVRPGGIFVIEDTLTSYSGFLNKNYVDSNISCVDYFKRKIDDIHKRVRDRDVLSKGIDMIMFKQDMIVITKRSGPEGWLVGEKTPEETDAQQIRKDNKFREDLKGRADGK